MNNIQNHNENKTRAFLERCHAKAKEIKITNTTLYEIVGKGYIHETTFYRLWNNQQPEPRLELEIALRLCSALGLSVSDTVPSQTVTENPEVINPLVREAREDVARNTGEILNKRREEIEHLQDECDRLKIELEEKEKELKEIQKEHIRRIDQLCEDLRESRKMINNSYENLTNYEIFLKDIVEMIKNK